MCGIAGIISLEPGCPLGDLGPMVTALRHRGPDAEGTWKDTLATLGHRRLAIIDLSEAGRQPLANEDESVWITFNGEIYNFQALRGELEGLGHRFRTNTDTEVIVHAYEQWGTECVKRLRGMFAFAVWDARRRRLYVARDRVGKKPLFYARLPERFLFASELQGLLADPELPRDVDVDAIDAYLSLGYVPAPQTAFRSVRKLPPAHWLTVDLTPEGAVLRVERYWHLEYGPKWDLSEADACEALRERMTEAVRLRMISDVPLGAFLSGGIDSSIVVGLMAGLSEQPVKTFSIGFEEQAYNELEHARRVARRWGTDHTEFVVQPDALAILPTLVRHYGEPYADSSAIPTFYVSQLTRERVTVALNGDGGDESFAGYERYFATCIAEKIRKVPGSRSAFSLLSRVLPDSVPPRSRLRQLQRFVGAVNRPLATRYARWMSYFTPQMKESLYTADAGTRFRSDGSCGYLETLFSELSDLHLVDAAMALDVQTYLPFDLLVKVDITSMANALEARSPFLDHEVMEFAARLPADLKLRGGSAKYLLKRAFSDLLPHENVHRRKMGFGVPIGEWFRGPLRELVEDALLSHRSLARGYFRREEVLRLVTDHVERRSDHAPRIWNLLMLELWHREMVDAPRSAPAAFARRQLSIVGA